VYTPKPLTLWRISEFTSLDGEGGLHTPGRWHTMGHRVVYAAEHPALALLEALVRVRERPRLPPGYQLLQLAVREPSVTRWEGDLPPTADSRAWGDAWLDASETLLASVPAIVAPHSRNWLINPLHRDADQVTLVEAQRWSWDERLAAG
jgi:RES domain-containing protein